MNQTALIIIDVQVGLFELEKYGLKLHNADQLLTNIATLAQKARAAGAPVIYIQHTGSEGTPAAKGSPLWQIHPRIQPQPEDIIILKGHADAFYDTPLQEKLQSLQCGRLVIMGLQTEYCVDTTCRRAFSLGYELILVCDGHSTVDTDSLTAAQIIEHHNGTLGGKNPYAEKFVTLKPAAEIDF